MAMNAKVSSEMRLRYLWVSLLGQAVDIRFTKDCPLAKSMLEKYPDFVDNNLLQGVLSRFIPALPGFEDAKVEADDPESQQQKEYGKPCVVVLGAQWVPSNKNGQVSETQVVDSVVIPLDTIVRLKAIHVASTQEVAKTFKTDKEISKATIRDRDLQTWGAEGELTPGITWDPVNDKAANFDQFKTNKDKFNFVSTYEPQFYTTEVDLNKVDEKKLNEATRLADEIERYAKRDKLYLGEEGEFGAVLGPGDIVEEKWTRGLKVEPTSNAASKRPSEVHSMPLMTRTKPKQTATASKSPPTEEAAAPRQEASVKQQPQPQQHYPKAPTVLSGRRNMEIFRDEIAKSLHLNNLQISNYTRKNPELHFELANKSASVVANVRDQESILTYPPSTPIGKVVQKLRRDKFRELKLAEKESDVIRATMAELTCHNKNMPQLFENETHMSSGAIKKLRDSLGTRKIDMMLYGCDYRYLHSGIHTSDINVHPDWYDNELEVNEISDEPLPSLLPAFTPGHAQFSPANLQPQQFMGFYPAVPQPPVQSMPTPQFGIGGEPGIYEPGEQFVLMMLPASNIPAAAST